MLKKNYKLLKRINYIKQKKIMKINNFKKLDFFFIFN